MVNGGYIQIEIKFDVSNDKSKVIDGIYSRFMYAINNNKVIRLIGMYSTQLVRPFGSYPVAAYCDEDGVIHFDSYNYDRIRFTITSDDTVTKVAN